MSAPLFELRAVAFRQATWQAAMDFNLAMMTLFLDEQPTQVKRVWHDSGLDPGTGITASPNIRYLKDFGAPDFEGHRVWVHDAATVSGFPATIINPQTGSGSVTNHNKFAFSNGTDWYWEADPSVALPTAT